MPVGIIELVNVVKDTCAKKDCVETVFSMTMCFNVLLEWLNDHILVYKVAVDFLLLLIILGLE